MIHNTGNTSYVSSTQNTIPGSLECWGFSLAFHFALRPSKIVQVTFNNVSKQQTNK